jgi:uncharacterized protein YecE (DUF72 family)
MKLKIGCQGWNYADWVTKPGGETVFYPRGTKSNEMLDVYARAFETIEVDSTFYAIPAVATLENWYKKTPKNFSFALKLPREITHSHALREKGIEILQEFCERVLILQEKLGPVLIQLPPQFDASGENIRALLEFLPNLPETIRFTIEFRSRDWLKGETLVILKKYHVALCLTEGSWIPRGSIFEAAKTNTADFAYVRFMGERDLTKFDEVQREENANLKLWHEVLAEISGSKFVYFSNFYEGFAPASANKFKQMFGQQTVEPKQLDDQPGLF